jgi:hypothetical protein
LPDATPAAVALARPTRFGPARAQGRSVLAASAAVRSGAALSLAVLGMVTLGFNSIRVASLAVSDLCFAACGGVIVLQLLTGRERNLAEPEMRRTSPLILVGAILLLTAGTVSSFDSWDAFGSMQVVLRFLWLTFVWFWILRSVSRDRRALAIVAKGWRVGVLITAAIGVISEIGIIQIGAQNAEGRQTGFFAQPNEFAGLLAVGIPLLVLDTPSADGTSEGRRSLLTRLALVGLVLMAVASSGSMTATFSAVLGVGAAIAMMLVSGASKTGLRRQRNPITGIAIALCVGAGLFYLSTSDLPVVERFTRYQEGDSYVAASVDERENRNEQAIQRLPDTLIVGTGLQLSDGGLARVGGGGGSDPNAVLAIHNMYLKVAHEAGVPALIGMAVMMLTTFKQCWRLAFNTRGTELGRLSAALFGANVAGATQAMFQPIVYQRYFWIAMAMTGCLWAVRRQEVRRELRATAGGSG